MGEDGIDLSAAYRIEHHTPQGVTLVRQVVEPNRLAGTRMVSRVFHEVLAGFHARGETGHLVMVEEETGQVVEAAPLSPATGAEP